MQNTTVLIVDDDNEVLELVARQVRRTGFTVCEASDGRAALEVIRQGKIDIVISDLMMPGMTGLELLHKLLNEGFAQPFIVLTGFPSQDSTLTALRLGAFDYVEKPYDSGELKALLKEAARVSRAIAREGGRPPSSIQRLRALRPDEGGFGSELSSEERFFSETEPQLKFAIAAIDGLLDPEKRPVETAYLFRVYLATSEAAADLSESIIAGLADAMARLCTLLRVVPNAYTTDIGSMLTNGNETMIALMKPAELRDPESLAFAPQLDELLRQEVTRIERERIKSA